MPVKSIGDLPRDLRLAMYRKVVGREVGDAKAMVHDVFEGHLPQHQTYIVVRRGSMTFRQPLTHRSVVSKCEADPRKRWARVATFVHPTEVLFRKSWRLISEVKSVKLLTKASTRMTIVGVTVFDGQCVIRHIALHHRHSQARETDFLAALKGVRRILAGAWLSWRIKTTRAVGIWATGIQATATIV